MLQARPRFFLDPYDVGTHYQLATALQDLTQATRQPRRTFEHCRMAVEVIRNYFDPSDVKDARQRHIEGEQRLCSTLLIERKCSFKLDAMAARSRRFLHEVATLKECAGVCLGSCSSFRALCPAPGRWKQLEAARYRI